MTVTVQDVKDIIAMVGSFTVLILFGIGLFVLIRDANK
jgi:hypothetical protein